VRKSSTVDWIEDAVELPPAENVTKAALLVPGAARVMTTQAQAIGSIKENL
jgi:hypothetical protein